MRTACLALIPVAFAIALPMTWLARLIGLRLRALDTPPIPGQVKAPTRHVPNTGGVAIFTAIFVPMAGALAIIRFWPDVLTQVVPDLAPHLPGLAAQTAPALAFLGGLLVLHLVGLVDDRRPLGPYLKLVVMLAVAAGVVVATDSRLLTALDSRVGGAWLSIALSVVWIIVVTNALNFMDNMDGLTAGTAAIAGGCFMTAALLHGQWFIAASLGLLVGACLGFLIFNFPSPRASVFMGDSGSLVVGFTLAFLTVRTTYFDPSEQGTPAAGGWYGVFMPLVVLAVPLYDFASVCVVRIRQGRSPLVGDLNHFSHRLVRRGLSRRDAVLVIYGLTAITAISGISLGSLAPWQAILVGVQVMLVLLVVAVYEGRAVEPSGMHGGGGPPTI